MSLYPFSHYPVLKTVSYNTWAYLFYVNFVVTCFGLDFSIVRPDYLVSTRHLFYTLKPKRSNSRALAVNFKTNLAHAYIKTVPSSSFKMCYLCLSTANRFQ